MPEQIKNGIEKFFHDMVHLRDQERVYHLSDQANALYAEWFNNKNKKYNYAPDDNVKGIIAKYQDYCLRFALIVQIMQDGTNIQNLVTSSAMDRAIRLTEYFLGNMLKSMKILAPESPLDKLSDTMSNFYKSLPQSFTMKTALEVGQKIRLKPNNIRVTIGRWADRKNQILSKIGEQKNSSYEKMF
jgi:hypothetical protein